MHKQGLSETSRTSSDEEDEVSTSRNENEVLTKLGHTRQQMQMRRLISCFRSSPVLQRLLVLRKHHVMALTLLALISLYTVHYQVHRSHRTQLRHRHWPLPSVALKGMLPSTPLGKPKASLDSESRWPLFTYFSDLPSVDDPLWHPLPGDPNNAQSSSRRSKSKQTPPTIATCVPGLAKDVYDEKKVSSFIVSNQRQQVKAEELIFLFSDVNAVLQESAQINMTGEQWCQDAHKTLQNFHSNLIVVCVGERVTAGRARNMLSRVATSDILAYIDTDDQEEPERNQVIQSVFQCNPQLKLLIHSNYGTGHGLYGKVRYHPYDNLPKADDAATSGMACPDEQEGVEVIRGEALRDMLDQTHGVLKFGIRTVAGMRPGHLVVRRDVTRYVHSSSIYNGEDCLWARDIIYMYGRRDETAMFLNRPLTTYYQSSHSFNINLQ
jgi:hypothetical protein